MLETPDVSAAPQAPDVDLSVENAALRAPNEQLREPNERLRMLLEDNPCRCCDVRRREASFV